ncbi:MAG: TonB C-terminal domain-containing protein [Deltaproteobacteria bacterium]|nr:TonB C-terminal domain-containing protein [Deltaproteobacteria bacterium]MBW1793516.1 TonB C-terminal domain-containing protein [Deltaproteobacteria bacterium]MBW2331035.1 TonB C-terminal domain-containing protein [Deltaproteobacteria bacterium]
MVAHPEVLNQGDYTDRAWIGMVVLSIVCHILFFSGVLFLPELRSAKPYIPFAVEVDLVSLPQVESQPQAASDQVSVSAQAEVKRAPVEPVKPAEQPKPPEPAKELESVKPKEKPVQAVETRPEEVTDKRVSLAPRPLQVKRSLKQKTYNASRVIRSAIARIEKEAPESRPRPVLQAIDKLKEEVESHGGVVIRGGMARSGVSRKTVELLDIYNAEIWHRIQKNWAFSEEMVRGRTNLEATIIVKIMRKGEIRDIWFEKRSGNSYFDDSVFKAVKKSDPLPPLPEGYFGPFYDVGFRFNLSELQRRF